MNVFVTLAIANGVSGRTLRPVFTSASPRTPVHVEPSAKVTVACTPGRAATSGPMPAPDRDAPPSPSETTGDATGDRGRRRRRRGDGRRAGRREGCSWRGRGCRRRCRRRSQAGPDGDRVAARGPAATSPTARPSTACGVPATAQPGSEADGEDPDEATAAVTRRPRRGRPPPSTSAGSSDRRPEDVGEHVRGRRLQLVVPAVRPDWRSGATARDGSHGGTDRPAGDRRPPRRPARRAAAPRSGPCPGSSGSGHPASGARTPPRPAPRSPTRATGARRGRPRADRRARRPARGAATAEKPEATPTWWSVPASSWSPRMSDPTPVPASSLCQRKPATATSAVRACFTLPQPRFPGSYGPSRRLAMTPSSPAPSKRANQSAARSRSSVTGVRWTPATPVADGARPGAVRRVGVRAGPAGPSSPSARRSQATYCAGVCRREHPDARLGRVDPQQQRVEVEPAPDPTITISPSTTPRSGSAARSGASSSGK